MPVSFDQINGIADKAKFIVIAPFVPLAEISISERHINADDFITTIGSFEFVVNYGNKKYRKTFSIQDIEKLIDSWRREIRGTPRPHISLKR